MSHGVTCRREIVTERERELLRQRERVESKKGQRERKRKRDRERKGVVPTLVTSERRTWNDLTPSSTSSLYS